MLLARADFRHWIGKGRRGWDLTRPASTTRLFRISGVARAVTPTSAYDACEARYTTHVCPLPISPVPPPFLSASHALALFIRPTKTPFSRSWFPGAPPHTKIQEHTDVASLAMRSYRHTVILRPPMAVDRTSTSSQACFLFLTLDHGNRFNELLWSLSKRRLGAIDVRTPFAPSYCGRTKRKCRCGRRLSWPPSPAGCSAKSRRI